MVHLLYRPTAMKNLYVLHHKKQNFDIAVTLILELIKFQSMNLGLTVKV